MKVAKVDTIGFALPFEMTPIEEFISTQLAAARG
jgi:hypothetical protein